MQRHFTLGYLIEEGWYVGKLQEVPGVFSQGESLDELEKNIKEAYQLMMEEGESRDHPEAKMKDIAVDMV